jgi:DNA-nicking Smr family endonuclease
MTKKLPPDEQLLWDAFVKNIKPLKSDRIQPVELPPAKIPYKQCLPEPKIRNSQKVEMLHANDLRSMRLDGQLDLHGFTRQSGESALREFLKNAVYKNWRWVRVITGKGSLSNPSILREQTPNWLQSMPEFVTGYANAKPDDGGSGAFYVKIRRKSKI